VTAQLPAAPAQARRDELVDVVRRGDAAAVRALADGYGASLHAPERRRRGAFATPPALAATLARHALPAPVRAVVDPACGPGALLRAAFTRLLALGADTRAAFAALHGADADPAAAALCRAVLAVDAQEAGLDEPLDRLVRELEGRILVGDALLGPVPARPGSVGVPRDRNGDREGLDWAAALPGVLAVRGAAPDPVTGWRGGFDAVVLNPPWERLKVAVRDWAGSPPAHLRAEQAGAARAVREDGRHPLTGTGEVNAYLPFLETGWRLLSASGRLAAVVPDGVVSDRSSSALLRAWLESDALETVRVLTPDRPIFEGVSARVGATVLVLRSGPTAGPPAVPRGACVATRLPDADAVAPTWRATAASVALVNPNTRTLPAFGSAAEAELVGRVHARVPVLVRRSPEGALLDDPWQLRLVTPLHMTRDAASFTAAPGPGLLPLWEAKHAGLLDHRGGGTTSPRYWVARDLVERRFAGLVERGWLAGYRNVTTTAAGRTLLPCALPVVGVGNSLPLVSAPRLPLLLAALASLPVDFLARCRHVGANLNFFKLEQVPVPPPSAYDVPAPWEPSVSVERWVLTRFARAVAWTPELAALAAELRSLGVEMPAHLAPAARRERAQAFAELDAAHAVLLGMTRDDVELVLSSFSELRRRDESTSGTFATATRVLAAYDTLTAPFVDDDQGSFRDHDKT
jgi:hypothetical protein